jgi:hypothetical protein
VAPTATGSMMMQLLPELSAMVTGLASHRG